MSTPHNIGTLREQQLHASLKLWLAQPGDVFEQKVDGYHIDIVRGELLMEIQTTNFSAIRTKLKKLLDVHPMLLIHPIPATKWIVRETKLGRKLSRRKSPKQGRIEHIFDELLYIPEITNHPNFRLQVLLTEQEEIWRDDGRGSWRRKHWSVADKVLLNVVDSTRFETSNDYLALLPDSIATPFTHRQLADLLDIPLWVSTRMSYCLRRMGALEVAGKRGRTLLLVPAKRADSKSE